MHDRNACDYQRSRLRKSNVEKQRRHPQRPQGRQSWPSDASQGEDQRGTPSVGRCKSRLWGVARYEAFVKKSNECFGWNMGCFVILLVCEMLANCQTIRDWLLTGFYDSGYVTLQRNAASLFARFQHPASNLQHAPRHPRFGRPQNEDLPVDKCDLREILVI